MLGALLGIIVQTEGDICVILWHRRDEQARDQPLRAQVRGAGPERLTAAAGWADCRERSKAFVPSTDDDTELREGGEEGSEHEAAGRADGVGPDNPGGPDPSSQPLRTC